MLTISVWPRRLKEFLLTHSLYKSPRRFTYSWAGRDHREDGDPGAGGGGRSPSFEDARCAENHDRSGMMAVVNTSVTCVTPRDVIPS